MEFAVTPTSAGDPSHHPGTQCSWKGAYHKAANERPGAILNRKYPQTILPGNPEPRPPWWHTHTHAHTYPLEYRQRVLAALPPISLQPRPRTKPRLCLLEADDRCHGLTNLLTTFSSALAERGTRGGLVSMRTDELKKGGSRENAKKHAPTCSKYLFQQ
ncbi:hypothetical protein LZ32DRAFT_293397 [Colletotrichum eremochloae]|nr:hypothetical protein LZ32DRAFT_293397 [Colletotrichum eremochloae]